MLCAFRQVIFEVRMLLQCTPSCCKLIDSDWELQTRLVFAKGLEDLPHTGENIMKLTYEGLHTCGIDKSVVDENKGIHMCKSDEESNMIKACKEMEGPGCVCHREQNCLGGALSIESFNPLSKNIKGICAHFYRSDKEHSHFAYCFSLRPYIKDYVVASMDLLDYASLGGS